MLQVYYAFFVIRDATTYAFWHVLSPQCRIVGEGGDQPPNLTGQKHDGCVPARNEWIENRINRYEINFVILSPLFGVL